MTAPPELAHRLVVVAAWDVDRIRGAVATLTDVSGHLVRWRARLEGIGRALESGDCWAGAAARSAVASVEELSMATWAMDGALDRSLAACQRMASAAAAAQEWAGIALAEAARADPEPARAAVDAVAAGTAGWWGSAGPPTHPFAALTALEHAEATAVAAREAGTDLRPVEPAVGGIPAQRGLAVPPRIPSGRDPSRIAVWWAGLPLAAQEAVISSAPAVVGSLDGVPAWARDRANRLLLRRALAEPEAPHAAGARVVAARIAVEEAAGRQVQLQLLDLRGDRVALAIGDLDTADVVALVVPGIFNTPEDDLGHLIGDTVDLGSATRAAAGPATSVATMLWLGYRTPSTLFQAAGRASAERGGPALASALDGLAAGRRAVASTPGRTTVVAHSYGTYVVDEAADEPGDLAADAVVLLGSPGMEDDAASLEVPAVFDAATPGDPITYAGWFGDRHPWEDGYGATDLPTDVRQGHSGYFDPGHPTLAAMGEVVAGSRRPE
jgi:hypothetical protein